VQRSVPAAYTERAAAAGVGIHEYLTELAAAQDVGEHGLVALDWHGGNRSVLVDHELSGVLVGTTLATRPEDVYRALLEATAYGTRTIVEAFERSGVAVTELVVAGGLLRNRFLMQLYADVCRRPLSVIASDQGPALGSAIHAAVAAGVYPDVQAAARAMGKVHRAVYLPNEDRAAIYDLFYEEYRLLHDYFGRGGNDVLHRLRAVRRSALARSGRLDAGPAAAMPAARTAPPTENSTTMETIP
jgi:L-ribulokinase